MRKLETCVALTVAMLLVASWSSCQETNKNTEVNETPTVNLHSEGDVSDSKAHDKSTPPAPLQIIHA